ncbi:uncharacterized protein LOC103310547 [Acyrthosiphon pisum]|uniref:MADF domain-containing protein n=1 Tax=Acyrthosiphon pisum TaxID=7029 RepID=A0A8R2FC35_ACYPI|nr:uncharacterized protein LOC103310547 [Acyrthosiphon pisum]|eukprot:XP_008187410.1 PREDICTED: uncharacterized protein LOC103310547 [Acyrthosiphon pisum]
MNTEMLIELVRERSSLYDMSDKKYSDHPYKESLWREIASEINQPVQNCKKIWTSLRDGYRRAAKKSITVSGQKTKFVKKWKYADEMEFLKPHMKERDSISNIDVVTDDEDDVLSHSDDEEIQVGGENSVSFENAVQNVETSFSTPAPVQPRQKKCKKTSSLKPPETASSTLMKYIIEQKNSEQSYPTTSKLDAMDQFFLSMCSTVKQFSPYFQHIAKTKIFHIISELELEQLRQNQPQTQSTISNQDSLQHPSQVQTQTVPTLLQLNHLPSFQHPRPQTTNHTENPDHSNITDSASPSQFNMFDYPTNGNYYYPKSSD